MDFVCIAHFKIQRNLKVLEGMRLREVVSSSCLYMLICAFAFGPVVIPPLAFPCIVFLMHFNQLEVHFEKGSYVGKHSKVYA